MFFTGLVETANRAVSGRPDGSLEIGVRPEFVSFGEEGIPAEIASVSDAGRFRIVDTRLQDHSVKLLVAEGTEIPAGPVKLALDPGHTRIYADGWMLEEGAAP